LPGGPGSYDFGKKFGEDVKTFEFGQRRESPVAENPGPGDYEPKMELLKDRVPTVKIQPFKAALPL
jgi:hypothetical protein